MADAVVFGVGHPQTGVPVRFRGRIVAIEIGALRSTLHHDGIDPYARCPIKGVSVQVADSDGQRAIAVRAIGQISALKLQLSPSLT